MMRKNENYRLADLGEFGFIDQIARHVRLSPDIKIGIGDDAAAFRMSPGCLALTTADMLLEGVHFDLSLCDGFSLGRKSLAVNLSDIAAMGAQPLFCLLSLAFPETTPMALLSDFVAGLHEIGGEYGVSLIGGDTCASRSGIVIGITLYGAQKPDKIVQRSTARPGDVIFVTGNPGDSALGLKLLRDGIREGQAVARHLDPTPRVREGLALAESELASAMIDISDGLLSDLGHIAEKSSVGARVYLEKIPLSQEYRACFGSEGNEGYALALGGGEDYELLFTAPAHRRSEVEKLFRQFDTTVCEIGEITTVPGIRLLSSSGEVVQGFAAGFDHFSVKKQHAT